MTTTRPMRSLAAWKLPLLAILCAAGMWTYADRVLIPHQVSDAAAHGWPRGNLSDLYKQWIGAQELLLHGRDPYSAEVTREIQAGYYGRPLDPDRRTGQNYEQAFSYPVYVAFYLAPTIHLPFAIVRKGFFWVLFGLTVATIPLWPRVLRWSVPLWGQVSLVVFTLGSLPVMQGLKLQQITLFVVPLLAVAMALLVSDRPVAAGVLLALATIKPQLVLLLLVWLTIWTVADWRRRYRWAASFLVSMAILWATSEWYLPHWVPRFWQAVREYHSYTGEMSVMDELVGFPWSRALELLAFTGMIGACWRERRQPTNSDAFAFTLSLVLATTILLVPSYGPYNQVLLIPALLIALKQRRAIWQGSIASRVLFLMTAGLILWPWFSATALAGLSFILPEETVARGWALPFWTVIQIPVAVVALMLAHYYQGYYQKTFAAPAEAGSS
ncbi:MAG: glycosyltransferase family 87 protein [Terriglobales bacterium]